MLIMAAPLMAITVRVVIIRGVREYALIVPMLILTPPATIIKIIYIIIITVGMVVRNE